MASPFSRLMALAGPARAIKLMTLYPPYVGAGVVVDDVSADMRSVTVSLRAWPWNQNAVGTHFGGSLYSLCDPWFMLLLMARLGRDFIVWDKAATIHFERPGRGRVHAVFAIDAATEAQIRRGIDEQGKVNPTLTATVNDEAGTVVCRVEKVLSIRRKR